MLGTTINWAQFQQLPPDVIGPDQKPDSYTSVEDPTVGYASQGAGLTPARDRTLSGKVELLKANQNLFGGWNGVAGDPPPPEQQGPQAPPAQQGPQVPAGQAGMMPMPTKPPPVPVQIRNEHVQVDSMAHRQPLVTADENGRLQGDKAVIQSFTTAARTHEIFEEGLGRDFGYLGSNGGRLTVNLNDPSTFINGPHQKIGQGIVSLPVKDDQTAADPDVVSHETAHAVLDAHRPEYSRALPKARSMHEAFADTTSLLQSLENPDVRADVLARRREGAPDNMASTVGEGLAKGQREAMAQGPARTPASSLLGTRKPQPPSDPNLNRQGLRDLAAPPPEGREQPTEGEHSASKRFSHAVYQSVQDVELQIRKANPGIADDEALKKAGDAVRSDFVRTLDFLPGGNSASQSDLARAMIKADRQDQGGAYADIYKRNFEAANVPVQNPALALQEAGVRELARSPEMARPEALAKAPAASRASGSPMAPHPEQPPAIAAADAWLAKNTEALGLSDGKLRAQEVYHNDRKETWVRYTNGQAPRDPAATNTLRVGFGADGKLIHSDPRSKVPEPPPMFPTLGPGPFPPMPLPGGESVPPPPGGPIVGGSGSDTLRP